MARWLMALLAIGSAVAQSGPQTLPERVVSVQREQAGALASEWILDSQPNRQAWAAYLIARDRRTELLPALLELLSRYESSETPASQAEIEKDAALQSIVDALIQLDAVVPAKDAEKLFSRLPAPALILLAHNAEQNSTELLSIWKKAKSREVRLAAGNLLVKNRVAGVAKLLLDDLTVSADVLVIDPGAGAGFGRGGSSYCGAEISHPQRDGWPEIGAYRLTLQPERGNLLLSSGSQPVYYARTVSRSYFAWADQGPGQQADSDRIQYLADLLQKPATELPLKLNSTFSIPWTGQEAYRQKADALVESMRESFVALVSELRRNGLLTGEEQSDTSLRVQWTVHDSRANRAEPLPETLLSGGDTLIRYLR